MELTLICLSLEELMEIDFFKSIYLKYKKKLIKKIIKLQLIKLLETRLI